MTTNWPALLGFALRNLRLSPDTFWRLTPAEFALLAGFGWAGAPMTRDRMEALSRAFPDRPKETDHG